MLRLLEILYTSAIFSVVQAGWDEYVKELEHLQFQNSSAFREHIQHVFSMAELPTQTKFPCEPYRLEKKTSSVHYLRPGDIKVVGALGDSITAGNGIRALTVFGSLTQFRGYSWDIGSQSDYEHNVRILPNILKYYNPELSGTSVGTGPQGSEVAGCNVAAPGRTARDVPGQAKLLIEKLKTLEGSSYQDDWKLITIFVGGNDLCRSCEDPYYYSPQNYTKFISEALDELAANVPRAFVNIVTMFDLTALGDLKGGIICDLLHWKLCNCALDKKTQPVVQEMVQEYTRHLNDLITSGRYDTRDDFTVVLQPFFKDNDIPRSASGEGDLSYFAHDCFHFNQKGHNSMATALWNAMFEPVGKKSTKASVTAELYCPTKEEPFATAKNSLNIKQMQMRNEKPNGEIDQEADEKSQGQENDAGRSDDVIQDGRNSLAMITLLVVISVGLIGYVTFFLFQWSVTRINKISRTAEYRSRNNLLSFQPARSYQSISDI